MTELKDLTGEKAPQASFKIMEKGNWKDLSTQEIFEGKRVIIHALPGAATPTCSTSHLPRYDELYPIFRENGIDEVYCLSVNDTFVMNAWKKELGVKNVKMLPDGNCEFTEKMGMLVDKEDLGFGKRSWRYSMVVDNGVIEKMFIEPQKPGDPFEVSDADSMMAYIAPNAEKPQSYVVITRDGCPFCENAKNLLTAKGIDFKEVRREDGVDAVALRGITGNSTYPQIFVEGKLIGDSEALIKYFD